MSVCVCVCLQRVGFLPSAGEPVTWLTLQEPTSTLDFHWAVLDVTPAPEEENAQYCKQNRDTYTVNRNKGTNEGFISNV